MTRRLTNEQFKKKLSGFIDWDKFDFGIQYHGMRNPISIVCDDCGFERIYNRAQNLSDYTGRYTCQNCEERERMSVKELIEFACENRHRGTLEVISDYSSISREDKIDVECTECGNRNTVIAKSYMAGKAGCRICAGSEQFTTEYVSQKIKELTNGEYELVGEYINSQVSIEIRHNSDKCDFNTWETGYGNFVRQGRRCPECTFVKSKGEQAVKECLDSRGATYESQYRFDDCRNNKPLPFDFAITEGDLVIGLIEYDGKQHYEVSTGMWVKNKEDAEEKLSAIQENDAIKEDYCLQNNIPLLIIPFWEFDNIDGLISDFLVDINAQKQIKL